MGGGGKRVEGEIRSWIGVGNRPLIANCGIRGNGSIERGVVNQTILLRSIRVSIVGPYAPA